MLKTEIERLLDDDIWCIIVAGYYQRMLCNDTWINT